MGRGLVRLSALEKKTRLLMSDNEYGLLSWPHDNYVPYGAYERTVARPGSTTASVTLISLQGPGILHFLSIAHTISGSNPSPRKCRVVVDGETCWSKSFTASTGATFVGSTSSTRSLEDNLVFYESMILFYECATATSSIDVITSWRLING